MKRREVNLKSGTPWLVLLLISNLFFSFVAWLAAPEFFEKIVLMLLLFTAMVVFVGYWINHRKQKKQKEALQAFLAFPDDETEQLLLKTTDKSWHPVIRTISSQMRQQMQIINDKQLELKNYQEFIEAWTHEIKTPLFLATLVLDNHKDEMSPYVYKRMKHVRHSINGNVEKILYYARLHADHKDYKLEKIVLSDFLQECLADFRAIAEEKSVDLKFDVPPVQVVSDKRVLAFMVSQLLSNAFKYTAKENGVVSIVSWEDADEDKKIHLAIRDNGKGVPKEDAPFLLDKGFTGEHPDRQNATGMGLYLMKKYAEALSIEISIGEISTSGNGFEIELIFPRIV